MKRMKATLLTIAILVLIIQIFIVMGVLCWSGFWIFRIFT